MKFLILTQYFAPEPGAAQARLSGFVRELSALGHEVEIVTGMPNYPHGRIYDGYRGKLYTREQWEGLRIHRSWLHASIGSGAGRVLNYLSFAVTSLAGLLRSARPDYIFVESPPPLLAFAAVAAARVWAANVILNVADLWPDTARDFGLMRDGLTLRTAMAFERWAYTHADYVCAVTEGIRAVLRTKGVGEEKILFLPNGIDTELYAPIGEDHALKQELGLSGKQVVLYPGTLGYAHGAENLLKAAAQIEDPSIHFLFVGSGSSKKELVAIARDMKLRNVSFQDPVPAEDVPRWLSIASCGLVSVRNAEILDGARPAKMFAIMACAKPVVYAGSGEGARLLSRADAGIVAPLEQPGAIANAIRTLTSTPAVASELGRNGRRFVQSNLRWERLVRDWMTQLAIPIAHQCSETDSARAV